MRHQPPKFDIFLAHLSRKLRMSYSDHSLSVVRLSVRPFTALNDFSSETPGPNIKGVENMFTHGPLIKMAAMPIYVSHRLIMGKT